MRQRPIVIGLAGGIGSGKTLVAKLFKKFGAKIIDADKIAHKIINYPSVKQTLLKWYKKKELIKDGQIDRKKLAKLSFVNTSNTRQLNRLSHPFIKKEIYNQLDCLKKHRNKYIIIIDAPLLFETNLNKLCNYIVFIKTPYRIRLKRLADSRKWTYQEVRKREKYQMPIRKKQCLSDFLINNNGSAKKTKEQVRIFLQGICNLYAIPIK